MAPNLKLHNCIHSNKDYDLAMPHSRPPHFQCKQFVRMVDWLATLFSYHT